MNLSTDLFTKLRSFHEPELQKEILTFGKIISANKGDILIREGQYLNFLPIVIEGRIRVYRESDDREILLYYVGPEQTCMMSLSSAYFDYNSTANGVAVMPTEILVLPAHVISDWQLRYRSWNQFIISTFKSRYDELLNAFGSIAFKPVHTRLEEYLDQYVRSQNSNKVLLSHQTLANELGTTRVVVSRILKQLEAADKLKLHRGYIQVKHS
jgi:CRP/FNR family transcriptional regulator, anaerobic regulatory protein